MTEAPLPDLLPEPYMAQEKELFSIKFEYHS